MSYEQARNVRAQVRATLSSPASGLIRVPEIERDSTEDAIRKLQVQVFQLTDAVVGLVEELERLKRGGR